MPLVVGKKGGRFSPDNQAETLVADLLDAAFNHPEQAGLKAMALAQYVVSLNLANQFDFQLTQAMMAFDNALQSALTQAGCQRSDFATAANCSPNIQVEGPAAYNKFVPKVHKYSKFYCAGDIKNSCMQKRKP